jgi:hypothetical protein
MTALPAHFYRDPLEALITQEEQTCKGCHWRRVIDRSLQCTNPRVAEADTNLRCNEFEERE